MANRAAPPAFHSGPIVRSFRSAKILAGLGVASLILVGACSGSDEKVVVVPGWGPSAPGAPSSSGGSSNGSTPGSSGSDGGVAAATGVPCDVATMLAARCTSCHSDPPMASALAGLVTYDQLRATSKEDPTKTEAELSVVRMQSSASPMPPGGSAPATDVTLLQKWISDGYPTGSCGTGGGTAGADGGVAPPHPSDGGTTSGAASDLPCDVGALLAKNCTSCHSDPPLASALAGLVTYADLMATAKEDATKTEAQLSLTRMQSSASPMPPSGMLSAADIATMQKWVSAGALKGSCTTATDAGVTAPPPSVFDGAPAFVATTGPSTHNAGKNCMSCHSGGGGDAPTFAFGGTLYDGNGKAVAGAEIRMVDANGAAVSVHTSTSGTFYRSGSGFAGPAHVGARNATAKQDMFTALQSTSQPPASTGGACSSCHCTGTGCTQPQIHLP